MYTGIDGEGEAVRYARWRSCVVVDVVADVRLMSKAYVLVLLVVSFIALQLRLNNAALVDATDVAAVSRTAAVARIRCETALSSHEYVSTRAVILLTAGALVEHSTCHDFAWNE